MNSPAGIVAFFCESIAMFFAKAENSMHLYVHRNKIKHIERETCYNATRHPVCTNTTNSMTQLTAWVG
ncbi:MAG: hypothetical protein GY861_27220 [bacterium]|nr:hypothetical protein [bacterium]